MELKVDLLDMGIILWIVFGAIVGFIASNLMGSGDGLMWNIIIGIIGALVGGFIMNGLGYSGISGFNLYSFIVAIFGAIISIWVTRSIRRNRA